MVKTQKEQKVVTHTPWNKKNFARCKKIVATIQTHKKKWLWGGKKLTNLSLPTIHHPHHHPSPQFGPGSTHLATESNVPRLWCHVNIGDFPVNLLSLDIAGPWLSHLCTLDQRKKPNDPKDSHWKRLFSWLGSTCRQQMSLFAFLALLVNLLKLCPGLYHSRYPATRSTRALAPGLSDNAKSNKTGEAHVLKNSIEQKTCTVLIYLFV